MTENSTEPDTRFPPPAPAPEPPGQSYALRDYQEEALAQLAELFFGESKARLLVEHPTGVGKTVLVAHLPRHPAFSTWMQSFPARRRKVLVVAHRVELLHQAADKFSAINPTLRVAIEGRVRGNDAEADVLVASVAALGRNNSKRLGRLRADAYRIVIVDEAHHAVAPVYKRVLKHFGLLPRQRKRARTRPKRLLLGITATPTRADGVGLNNVFDAIAHSLPLLDMIEAGHLCPLRAYQVFTRVRLDHVRQLGGDFEVRSLSRAINRPHRNALVLKAYQDLAAGRKALVYGADVAHAEALASVFNTAGIPTACVTGHIHPDERKRWIADFMAGRLSVLTNCMVLTEGFDCPDIGCVILARPTESNTLYRQMVGRGTRRAPGKNECLIIDVVDNTTKHNLMAMGRLVGLPARFPLKGQDITTVARRGRAIGVGMPAGMIVNSDVDIDDWDLLAVEVPLWRDQVPSLDWVATRAESAYVVGLNKSGTFRVAAVMEPGGRWRLRCVTLRPVPEPVMGFRARWVWTFPLVLPPPLRRPFPTPTKAKIAVERWLEVVRAARSDDYAAGCGRTLRDSLRSLCSLSSLVDMGESTPPGRGRLHCRYFHGGSILLGLPSGTGLYVLGQIAHGDGSIVVYVRDGTPLGTDGRICNVFRSFLITASKRQLPPALLSDSEFFMWVLDAFNRSRLPVNFSGELF